MVSPSPVRSSRQVGRAAACYTKRAVGTQVVALLSYLLFFGAIIAVIWQVISCLRRISRGVEDMAGTLRRIELGMAREGRGTDSGASPSE